MQELSKKVLAETTASNLEMDTAQHTMQNWVDCRRRTDRI